MATKKSTESSAQKKLEDLTEEQEAILAQTEAEYDVGTGEPDMEAIKAWLEVVYPLYNQRVPDRTEIALSPFAALALAKELTGEDQAEMDWCGISDAAWIAQYDTYRRLGVLTEDEAADVMKLREFQRCAWDSVLLDGCAIIVALPKTLKRDDAGSLHSTTGPALEWRDGNKEWSWHGTWVPERVISNPRSFTKEEYLAIDNTEVRRALGETAGWQWITELLGAKVIDTWRDEGTGLSYELLAGETERWLKKQSPSLKDGAQPVYVEPVHEDLRTARAARKWQATRLAVEQCERDPDLRYGVEA